MIPERAAGATLAAVLVGAAAIFGGVYLWGSVALAVLGAALMAAVRCRPSSSLPARVLDWALLGALGIVLLQLVPLPAAVVNAISPSRAAYVAATSLSPEHPAYLPLTVDPAATVHAALALFCVAATFWTGRTLFARGGVRTFTFTLSCGAIVLAFLAFAQHASGTGLVYGFWRPQDHGARPLGPFINRNHFGTWSLMVMCLCVGYLQWRRRGSHTGPWRARVAALLDGRAIVLQLALALLAVVTALGASRSALVALACAGGYVATAAPRLRGAGRARSFVPVAALGLLAMLAYGDGRQLLLRLDETRATGLAGRLAIWRDSLAVIQDFPLTGVGAGAFATAMRVYQTTPRTYYYNEAHNHYLQLAAEGGLLLSVPALAGLGAVVAAARERRRRDAPFAWIRVAAEGALVGVAIQSVWETGLSVPANGMLAAAVAALLVAELENARPAAQRPQRDDAAHAAPEPR